VKTQSTASAAIALHQVPRGKPVERIAAIERQRPSTWVSVEVGRNEFPPVENDATQAGSPIASQRNAVPDRRVRPVQMPAASSTQPRWQDHRRWGASPRVTRLIPWVM
jgi:hypothetical protein